MLAGCASRGRAIECRLERLVHQGGRARAQSLDRQLATPVLVGHSREMVEIGLQAVEHDRVGVAQLEQRLGPAGDDAFLAGVRSMRPVVQTERGPQISGKRWSIILKNRTSSSPASRRRTIEVVPA